MFYDKHTVEAWLWENKKRGITPRDWANAAVGSTMLAVQYKRCGCNVQAMHAQATAAIQLKQAIQAVR